jgi:hypothetical protein
VGEGRRQSDGASVPTVAGRSTVLHWEQKRVSWLHVVGMELQAVGIDVPSSEEQVCGLQQTT